MDTSNIRPQCVKVYRGEEFLGYVAKTTGAGVVVQCKIGNYPYHFPQVKAKAVKGAASKATVIVHTNGTKIYPRIDNLTFKIEDI